jgi:GntR family transcriptional regulator/MocR family aminotransferase
MYLLDTKSKTPLHIQLYEAMKAEIKSAKKVGDKLPSIRKVASEYNLSKTTVESAYAQLFAEGYIESRPKSGYYVSDFHFAPFQEREQITQKEVPTPYLYDFFPARLYKEDFPRKLYKRLFAQSIDESMDFGAYHDGQGELGLREEIVKYLSTSRGVRCDASQLVICAGFSDAMGLLAKLVRNRYSHYGIENPGYHIARRVFEEYGYQIHKIPVGDKGVELEALQNSATQILYITPSHQYPTGVTMPIANRLKLLEIIQQRKGLLIEDDYDSELAYYNRPIPALQGLDNADCVVYLGTFAKSLSPALRVSYMVLPKQLLPLYYDSYDKHFARVSITTQKTLERFMKEGHWERHLRKIRTHNKRKHKLLKSLLKSHLKESFTILAEGAGLAILIYPSVPFDWEKFKASAEENRIKLYFSKERCGGEFEAIRMGFGGFSEEGLKKAIEAFAKIWWQALHREYV